MVWHYKKTGGFWWPKSSEIRRNRSIPTNFRRTRPSVSFRRKKKIRRNFVRTSDDFLTNTEKRHSDELPTILRCGYTRPEFIGKTTIPTNVVPRFIPTNFGRRNLPTDIGRRNIPTNHVRRYIPTEMSLSVNSDGYMSVGIFRRPLSVGIYPFFFTN